MHHGACLLLHIMTLPFTSSSPPNMASTRLDGAAPHLPESGQKELIRALLRSHRQLPPDQLSSITGSLSARLACYDDEIAKLEAQLTKLVAERATLRAQYDDCRGLCAPIRRLPTEILGEIFALTVASTPTCSLLDRLAQMPLLILSRVCARWHAIIMDTPAFWGTIHLHGGLWLSPKWTQTVMRLLQSALDRGRDVPLTVSFTNASLTPPHVPALDLLARHSERWRVAKFGCPFKDMHHFAGIEGRLPLLEMLELNTYGEHDSAPVEFFRGAPRLRKIAFARGLGTNVATPALDQLHLLGYKQLTSRHLAMAVSGMANLSQAHAFQLEFSLDEWRSNRAHVLQLGIPPTSSDISRLSIDVSGGFHRPHAEQALAGIVASLTLPHLQTLEFRAGESPLPWPHAQFLDLAERSSFSSHLKVLCLSDVDIDETQLLECLRPLHALERLELADHQRADKALISNTLLRALTWTPDPTQYLAPRLRVLRLRSRLQFSDSVYLDLILSRIAPGRIAHSPFRSEILPLPRARALDPAVRAQLQAHKQVVFALCESCETV
ncbi:hypothetical protein FB451DRAFT_1284199 [Mycena latifolia]|nr:hypothetical protein FB451DRAFT_1284199 [Mycena latifolia]